MKASLHVLKDALGRKVAVLGDMGELGAEELQLHEEVGREAGKVGIDLLISVGERSAYMAEAARQENPELPVVYLPTLEELLEKLPELVEEKDTILVKASHFMNFEQVVEQLQKYEEK